MINRTKDYDIFIFRDDNREKIDQTHVGRIADSLRSRNMLDLKPILVNEKMEIMDGQHRVLAAKEAQVEIFYQIERAITPQDMLKLNLSKNWTISDYLNFYCHHQYDEYLKLRNFIKKHNITLRVGITIALGESKKAFTDFRDGKFEFMDEDVKDYIDLCWETIHYLQKINGFSPYLNSSRFWKALIVLFKHSNFYKEKWIENMRRQTDHFNAKVSIKDYIKMLESIYNWKNQNRIKLLEDDL